MTRCVALVLLLLLFKQTGSLWASSLLLETNGRHQSCLMVTKGKPFSVSFSANDPVLFSVTYTLNRQDYQLIGQQLTNNFNSELTAPETAYHCMNWLNTQAHDVRITWQHKRTKQSI